MINWNNLTDSSKKTFLDYLIQKKVPMQNLQTGEFAPLKLTKKGKFFYVNNKIIQAQIASKLYVLGMIEI